MAKKESVGVGTKLLIAVLLLLFLSFASVIVAGIILLFAGGNGGVYGANVAVIPVEGVIMATGDAGLGSEGVVTSDTIVDFINEAADDDSIKAVEFLINSPGGSAVASDEIGRAIRKLKKPSVAVIREVGASGGYWIASACDHVIANRMSITGSIGVVGSYLTFGRLLEHYNVTYNRFVSGALKDVGSPYREVTSTEAAFYQEKIDDIHHYFVQAVSENRNMSYDAVAKLATGEFMLGFEALDAGLVDELGGEPEALDWVNATIGEEPVVTYYKQTVSLLDLLSAVNANAYDLLGYDASIVYGNAQVPMAR